MLIPEGRLKEAGLLFESLGYTASPFSKGFNENELSSSDDFNDFQPCFNFYKSLSSLRCPKTKPNEKFYPISTQSKVKTITP